MVGYKMESLISTGNTGLTGSPTQFAMYMLSCIYLSNPSKLSSNFSFHNRATKLKGMLVFSETITRAKVRILLLDISLPLLTSTVLLRQDGTGSLMGKAGKTIDGVNSSVTPTGASPCLPVSVVRCCAI